MNASRVREVATTGFYSSARSRQAVSDADLLGPALNGQSVRFEQLSFVGQLLEEPFTVYGAEGRFPVGGVQCAARFRSALDACLGALRWGETQLGDSPRESTLRRTSRRTCSSSPIFSGSNPDFRPAGVG